MNDDDKFDWRTFVDALLPTFTGGVAVVATMWALCTPTPVAVVLGVCGFASGIVTIRLFMNNGGA